MSSQKINFLVDLILVLFILYSCQKDETYTCSLEEKEEDCAGSHTYKLTSEDMALFSAFDSSMNFTNTDTLKFKLQRSTVIPQNKKRGCGCSGLEDTDLNYESPERS